MSNKVSNALFWIKHGILVLITGTIIGLVGYKNMKTSSFELLSNSVKIRTEESQMIYTTEHQLKRANFSYDGTSN